ncbi:hypothetical protein BT63DRAFT_421445 [Microthyrium microscopicum]|uniref:Uncharacterized protein n=1 Tax=Microthyrium microscopicum TaxID=703497 RepID=A0A6A6UQS4_9PEZI|nr:hypothetical protein BT63DRAFT_421445 [Microthyrium microscopicum]
MLWLFGLSYIHVQEALTASHDPTKTSFPIDSVQTQLVTTIGGMANTIMVVKMALARNRSARQIRGST